MIPAMGKYNWRIKILENISAIISLRYSILVNARMHVEVQPKKDQPTTHKPKEHRKAYFPGRAPALSKDEPVKSSADEENKCRVYEVNYPIPSITHPPEIVIPFVHPHQELAHQMHPQQHEARGSVVQGPRHV
jgi:hypothetical protein